MAAASSPRWSLMIETAAKNCPTLPIAGCTSAGNAGVSAMMMKPSQVNWSCVSGLVSMIATVPTSDQIAGGWHPGFDGPCDRPGMSPSQPC